MGVPPAGKAAHLGKAHRRRDAPAIVGQHQPHRRKGVDTGVPAPDAARDFIGFAKAIFHAFPMFLPADAQRRQNQEQSQRHQQKHNLIHALFPPLS